MATTTNTNEPNQQGLLTVSPEKLSRLQELMQTLAGVLNEHVNSVQPVNSLQIATLYPDCKSLANWVESVSREKKIKASEIHRIDLRNGRVVIRPKKQSTSENNGNKSRRKK